MTTGSPPPSPESRFVAKVANALIQWTPVGGGGGLLIHFLLRQDWILSLLMFPVMLVTVVWAKYTENFIETFGASAGERGASDARSLSQSLARLNKDLQWRFSRADDKYRRAQANACRYYLVEGVGKNRWNPATMLAEVYVPLKLSGRLSLGFHQGDFEEMAQSGGGAELAKENAKAKPQYIWDLLRQVKQQPEYRQMAIIAPGGFGKTTLLRHVTYRYSYEPHRICREKQVPKLIPVLLYLRDCRGMIDKADAPDLPTLIVEHHLQNLSATKLAGLDVDWAKKLLSSGKALVMIDGFDEVAAAKCEAVSQWIDRAIVDYGTTATFILTTRPSGQDRYEGQRPLKLVNVEKFSNQQRDQFLQRWYLCAIKNERLGHNLDGAEDEAAREAADLIAQIEQRSELKKLADNPLLLCMIATYHKNNPARSLPLATHRLYKDFFKVLLDDRPRYKKMSIMLPAEESQAVLQQVALDMAQRDCIALPLNDMTQLVERSLNQCLESSVRAGVSTGDFIEHIKDVSELFVERQALEKYEFAHRSFQEYLAAVEVNRRQEESLLLSLGKEWRGTAVWYAAMVNPTSLIQQLCEKGDREALDLAYDCWLENQQGVPTETFERLKNLCYAQLEQYMVADDWKEADDYTYRLMIQVLGKRYGNDFTAQELLTFPCADLLRIEGLWVQHSQGRFGFSVQKEIYERCGGKLDGKFSEQSWVKFIQAVGWCKDSEKKYDTFKEIREASAVRAYKDFIFLPEKAVEGHLPLGTSLSDPILIRVSLLSHPDL
jgi:hypothetical protein